MEPGWIETSPTARMSSLSPAPRMSVRTPGNKTIEPLLSEFTPKYEVENTENGS
jgi:hypothetical protein